MSKVNHNEVIRALKGMKDFLEVHAKLYGTDEDDDDDECDDCDENKDHKEIIDSLKKDYNHFMKWCLHGLEQGSNEEFIKRWKSLHPNLPVPRSLQVSSKLSDTMCLPCLFIDAYPLYLEEIGKDR